MRMEVWDSPCSVSLPERLPQEASVSEDPGDLSHSRREGEGVDWKETASQRFRLLTRNLRDPTQPLGPLVSSSEKRSE